RKGIDLLYEVALTKEAQFEEVRKKSLKDFYKTHPSGFGIVTKTAPSVAKIKPSITNKGTFAKPGAPDVTEEESSESETESWVNDEDDSNNKQKSRSEGSDVENDSDDKNTQSDSEKGSDFEHETNENESDFESDQEENEEEIGDDEEEEEDEFLEPRPTILMMKQRFLIKLKNEVLVTSSSHSYELAAKFLNFLDIPHIDAEIVSPVDVHIHHEVPSKQTPILLTVPVLVITESSPIYSIFIPQSIPSFTPLPPQSTPTPPPTTEATNPQSTLPDFASVFQFNNKVTALEKEVAELKKHDPLKTQVTALVDEHLDARLGATKDEFMNFLSASIIARITKQVKNQLPQILPVEVPNSPFLASFHMDHQSNTPKWEFWPNSSDKQAQVRSKEPPRGINHSKVLPISGQDQTGQEASSLGFMYK
nr:hypothetical protein [Tanacetum cinerariifolium]GEZ79208.1 hypothetical protein [Tanacetum cinerariifolium]